MQSRWKIGVANSMLEFSGEDFFTKIAVRSIKYFVSFKLKSLKSDGFRQNIILSKDRPPTSKLFGSLD